MIPSCESVSDLPFSASASTGLSELFYSKLFHVAQARKWIDMWHGHMGDDATPANLVVLLDSYGFAKDVADKIRRKYHM